MKTTLELRPILSALMRSKTGAILVALQVAVSLAILANAIHIVNLRLEAAARPSGLADEASTFYLRVHHLVKGGHNEQIARQHAETDSLRAIGGVKSVAWANQMPMSWNGSTATVSGDKKEGAPVPNAAMYISPDSLVDTLGLRLVEGRDIAAQDVREIDANFDSQRKVPDTVVITRKLADKLWPGAAGVIGKTLYFGYGRADVPTARVIGVVEMLQTQGAENDDTGYYSLISPARISDIFDSIYVVRTEPGQRDRVMKEAEAALRKSAATPVQVTPRTVEGDRDQRYRADKALAWMLVTVSVLLLLVTASGIVGMASLWVNQRRKQIGVRRALGARRVDILRYFLTENVLITSLGVACGVPLALGLNTLLVRQLNMAHLPLPYLGAGALVFWGLGAAAAFGPSWRAASISPATATRTA